MMYRIFFLFVLLSTSVRGQQEGETCVDEYSNTFGECKPVSTCVSARKAFDERRRLPTFCSYNEFGERIVCCRDGSSIFNPTNKYQDDRPVWGSTFNNNDRKRVSERKCEEYSRSVVKKAAYIPLIPEPETFSVSEAKCEYTGLELIVGGVDAKLGEFPHMAAIGWTNVNGDYNFACGGSLISPRFVLTAAHCNRLSSAVPPEPVIVRLGDQNIDNKVFDGAEPIDVPIRKMYIHPDYDSPRIYDDIALLELAQDVKFRTGIRPACLWTKHEFDDYETAIASGWGVKQYGSSENSKELQKVSFSILDVRQCNRTLASSIGRNWINGFRDSQMCAGQFEGGQDTCQGDAGAPLQVISKDNFCIFHIIGITSTGKNCGQSGAPGIYTRVSSYLDWIESVMWPGQ